LDISPVPMGEQTAEPEKPRVAILIPSYNSSRTIGETLASIQRQAAGMERIAGIYVSDDASSDGTIEAARGAWTASGAVHILQRERNGGERRNVNEAVERLGGEADWILLMHSDDLAREDWLPHMLARIDRCDRSVATICSSWDGLFSDGRIERGEDNEQRETEYIAGTNEAVHSTLLRGCWWHISGCAIRLRAFQDIGEFAYDLPQKGDWEWLMRCLRKGWAVEYIPRTLILYRLHAASVSSSAFRRHLDVLESVHIVREYAEFLSSGEILRMHWRWVIYLARRLGKGLISGQWVCCLRAMAVLPVVLGNALGLALRGGRTSGAR
jgi:glycosyltransferase involved in cell wall biosynthesis